MVFCNFLGREICPPQKKNIFIKMGRVSSPVCREHVYIGRLHTGINNSIFKKSNAMSCQ